MVCQKCVGEFERMDNPMIIHTTSKKEVIEFFAKQFENVDISSYRYYKPKKWEVEMAQDLFGSEKEKAKLWKKGLI